MATRWARFARGWIVALFSTLVAAISHTLGGGAPAGLLPVVLSLAFAGIACIGLAGRTLSLPRVAVSVLVSQLIFHGLFSLGGQGGALATDGAAGAHNHSAIPVLVEATGSAGAASVHATGHTGWAMWLAHAVAAVVTIVALRHGERAFWGLFESARLVIRSLFAPAALVILPPAPRRTPTTAPVSTPRDLGVLLSSRSHRGPPPVARVA